MRLQYGLVLAAAVFSSVCSAGGNEEAFRWSAAEANGVLSVVAEVAPGAYLYAEETRISVRDADGETLSPVSAPSPVKRQDANGAVEIYPAGKSEWRFSGRPPFQVKAVYQGCRGDLCLLPATFVWPKREAELPHSAAGREKIRYRVWNGMATKEEFLAFLRGETGRAPGFSAAPAEASAEREGSENAPSGGLWWMLAVVLGGVMLNFTPCVLPMIPVNLAIIGAGATEDDSGRRRSRTGFFRGCAYAAGMVIAYGTLGGLSVVAGMKFGALNSMASFNFAVAAVFAVLGLAMLGVFHIDFGRFAGVDWRRFRYGKGLLAFFMGAVAALLAGACVAPVVIGVLLFAAECYAAGATSAAFYPLLLGLGMALPWPFAGAGLAVLPKPGRFMVYVKYLFAGFIFLLAAYYFAVGVRQLRSGFDMEAEVRKLDAAIAAAEAEKRPLLIDFHASWCKNCAAMEKTVLRDEEVRDALRAFSVVGFQAEDVNAPAVAGVLDRYGIKGLPAFVLIEPEKKGN